MSASADPRTPILRRQSTGGHVLFGVLLFGLIAGPIAWFLQLITNYAMASHYCFPETMPRIGMSLPSAVWSAILALNLAALVIAAAAALVSYRNCRTAVTATREGATALDRRIGGRSRFLSTWGGWYACAFFAATCFNLIAFFVVSTCYG